MKKVLTAIFALLLMSTSIMAQRTLSADNSKQTVRKSMIMNHQAKKLTPANPFESAAATKDGNTVNLTIDSYEGEYYTSDFDWYGILTATNGDRFAFDIVIDTTDPTKQTPQNGVLYTFSDMIPEYCQAAVGEDVFDADSATFIMTNGNITAMMSVNGTIYNLTYTAPVRPDTFTDTTLVFTTARLTDVVADQGMFQIIGRNDNGDAAALTFTSTQIAGTYDFYSSVAQYTQLMVNDENIAFDSLSATFTAGANAGEYDCVADIWAFNGYHYSFTISYTIPTVTSQVNITANNLYVDDSYAMFGIYIIGANDDNYGISIFATDFGAGTTFASTDINLYEIATDQDIDLYSGSLTFVNDSTLTGSLLDYNGVQYNVTLTGTITGGGSGSGPMQYDETATDFYATYTSNEVEVDDQYFDQYGVLLARLTNSNNQIVSLQIYPSGNDIAGTYTINETENPGTILASSGVQNGSVYPSFAGVLDAEGYIESVWFLRNGTVTITNNNNVIAMTINATNSADRSIYVTVNGGAGINDVESAIVNVYPNPTTGILNINAENVEVVEVMDINGRIIKTQRNAEALNMANLANGVYFVRVITANGTATQKIIKK